MHFEGHVPSEIQAESDGNLHLVVSRGGMFTLPTDLFCTYVSSDLECVGSMCVVKY